VAVIVLLTLPGKQAVDSITNANIRDAVLAWVRTPTTATRTYGDIAGWNTATVSNMARLFDSQAVETGDSDIPMSKFNGDIGSWNVASVTSMGAMFYKASFNRDLGGWNVARVANMRGMFQGTFRNGWNIGGWNTASASSLASMFSSAPLFNQNIGGWNTARASDMSHVRSRTMLHSADPPRLVLVLHCTVLARIAAALASAHAALLLHSALRTVPSHQHVPSAARSRP
jgi:hypothetical protein